MRQNPLPMRTVPRLSYNRIEIESFLPSGWNLDDKAPEGAWDEKKRAWRTTLYDGLELSWPLEVKLEAAEKKGRIDALKEAVDRVHHKRLGDHTRGLGLG